MSITDIVHFNNDLLCGESIFVRKKFNRTDYPVCHRHNYYEIIYYSNCVGSCNINGTDYTICDDCVFLVTPTDYHKISTVFRENSHSVNISFSSESVAKRLISEIDYKPRVCYNVSASLKFNINELYTDFSVKSRLSSEKVKSRFNLILAEILEKCETVPVTENRLNKYVIGIMEDIANNLSENITLTEAAKKYGLAPTYLSALFSSNVGITFKEYLTTVRVDYAKRLLKETDLPVISVGYECGWSTPSQFFRIFKKNTGTTPHLWRNAK